MANPETFSFEEGLISPPQSKIQPSAQSSETFSFEAGLPKPETFSFEDGLKPISQDEANFRSKEQVFVKNDEDQARIDKLAKLKFQTPDLPVRTVAQDIGSATGAPFAILGREAAGLAADVTGNILHPEQAASDEQGPWKNLMAAVMTSPDKPLPVEEKLAQEKGVGAAVKRGLLSAAKLGGQMAGAALAGPARIPSFLSTAGVFGSATYSETLDAKASAISAALGAAFPLVDKFATNFAADTTKKLLLAGKITDTQAKLIESGVRVGAMQATMQALAAPQYVENPSKWKEIFAENAAMGLAFHVGDVVKLANPNAHSVGEKLIADDVRKYVTGMSSDLAQIISGKKSLTSEPTPASPTPVGTSQPAQPATVSAAPVASDLPILPKPEIQAKSDADLQQGYQDYQEADKAAMGRGDLQAASNLITQARFHREEMQNRLEKTTSKPEAKIEIERYQDGIKVSGLGVPEEHQGKGIGTAAMEKVINESEMTKKPIYLTASTSADKQESLNRFYERLGFKHYKDDPLSNKPMYRRIPDSLKESPEKSTFKPKTIIGGIDSLQLDNNTHDILVKNRSVATAKFVNDSSELPAEAQGYKNFDGLFYHADPVTKRPTIYIQRRSDTDTNPIFTHETTHLLEHLGVIDGGKIDRVVKQYGNLPSKTEGQSIAQEVTQRYINFNRENKLPQPTKQEIKREIFANIFQGWHETGSAPKVSWVQRALDTIRGIFGLEKSGAHVATQLLKGNYEPAVPALESKLSFSASKEQKRVEPSSSKRAKIISDSEKLYDAATAKNKAVVDHQAEERDGDEIISHETWNVYSPERGNDKQATIFKSEDGTYEVSDEHGNSLGWRKDKKDFDRAMSDAKDHVESGSTQEHDIIHRDARSEILNTLDLPPDFRIKDIQDTKWDSVYYLLQKEIGRDSDGEPEYQDFKVSIRNHEPSPFREKEFGANDAWYEIPKNASLEQISEAVGKVERFAKRHSDSVESRKEGENSAYQEQVPIQVSSHPSPGGVEEVAKGATGEIQNTAEKGGEEKLKHETPEFSARKEKIVSAAVKNDDGSIEEAAHHGRLDESLGESGFVTNAGRFVSRIEAYKIAKNAGQIRIPSWSNPETGLLAEDIKIEPRFSARKNAQVAGTPDIGQERANESIEEQTKLIREKLFDSRKPVSDEQTAAWEQIFHEMTDPQTRLANAQQVQNTLGNSRIGLALYQVEAGRYALKLAMGGNIEPLRRFLENSNEFSISTGGGASDVGSQLRGLGEFAGDPVMKSLKTVFMDERISSAQRASGVERERFLKIITDLKNLKLTPEEVDKAIDGDGELSKKIDDVLEANSLEKREANSILDTYEKSQTEWVKEPKKLSRVRQIIKDALDHALTAKYSDEQSFKDFISGRFQEVGIDKAIADRLAFEVWKDKAARESAKTANAREKESRAEQRNAEALINQWEQSKTETMAPATVNNAKLKVTEWLKKTVTSDDRDGFINSLKAELEKINVTKLTADQLARQTWDKKVTLDANAKNRKKELVEKDAQSVAIKKLNELTLKQEGAEWMKPEGKRNLVLEILTDALKSKEPIESGRLERAAKTSKRLQDVGVDVKTADALGLSIEKDRETGFYNRRVLQMESAAKSNKVRGLVEEILTTPYNEQISADWKNKVAQRWFESNGLDKDQAAAASRLFMDKFDGAFRAARLKVLEAALAKGSPKTHDDLERMIRSGILDPSTGWLDKLAASTGWNKPTPEQFKKLSDLEQKLTNPELSPEEYKSIQEQQMSVILHMGKREGSTARAIGEAFTASLLSGVRTFTVQLSPLMMTIRDYPIMALSDPKNAMNFATAIFNSYKANAIASLKFAWQKDSYGFHLNELEHGYNELKRIAEETDKVVADKKSSISEKGIAYVKKIYALQRYVFRILNTLDQTQMAVAREWKLAYYSSIAFKEAGLKSNDISNLIDAIEIGRRNAYEKAVDKGLDHNTAQIRANSEVQQVIHDFVENKTGDSTLANKVLTAAENDYYGMVGRLPEGQSMEGEGMLSRYSGFNWFMQKLSEAKGKSGYANIETTSIFGMVNIPFRSMRFYSDFFAYGLLRYGIYKYRQNTGRDNLWKQSFGNELQARARFRTALAGTTVMLLATAWAAKKNTSDDDAGNEDFGLYVTGSGPSNKVLADAWAKRGFKQYSLNFVIGGHIVAIPVTRVGEALMAPFIVPAAIDDASWKKKETLAAGRPAPNPISLYTSELIGEHLSMTGQKGVFQTIGQLQNLSQQGGSALGKGAAKLLAGTASSVALPFKQLLASASDMFFGTMDSSSASALVANAFPIVGLPFQHEAVNRFGDKMYDRSWFGLASRTGIPIAFQVDKNPTNETIYQTLFDTGAAPPPIKRYTLEEKYGPLTDEQFATIVRTSGETLKKNVDANISLIKTMSPVDARKFLVSAASKADLQAANSIGLVPEVNSVKAQNLSSQTATSSVKKGRTKKARKVRLNLAGRSRSRIRFRQTAFKKRTRSAFS